MDRRMLINAVHPEEIRIAITENNTLTELEIETDSGRKLKGNITRRKSRGLNPASRRLSLILARSAMAFCRLMICTPPTFAREMATPIIVAAA